MDDTKPYQAVLSTQGALTWQEATDWLAAQIGQELDGDRVEAISNFQFVPIRGG